MASSIFAGDVDYPKAGIEVANVHDLLLPIDPVVVRPGLRNLVASHFPRPLLIGEVRDVDPPHRAAGHALFPGNDLPGHARVERVGFVPGEDV